MSEKVYIVGGVRTPFGSFLGSLKDIEVSTLASIVIRGVLKKSNVNPEEVDVVHLGNCNTAESQDVIAPVIARQALLQAGLPKTVLSSTVDKACCSGTEAVKRGFDSIRLGEAGIAVVGGVQTMSRTPHVVRGVRGKKLGNVSLEDCLFPLGYKDYNPVSVDAGEVALEYGIGRNEQDQWAYQSQYRYQMAEKSGKLDDEIIPVEVTDRKGNHVQFEKDEFPKPHTTMEKLESLPTIYGNPTVTAGNSPGLNNGAAALVLMSESKLKELNVTPLAEIMTVASVAERPNYLAITPAYAIMKALKHTNIPFDDVSLIEINEAFAAVPLVSSQILAEEYGKEKEEIYQKLNVNGGSIAIGHPVGATGARIVMTLMYELKRRGGGYGAAAICGGLAQGDAIMIKV